MKVLWLCNILPAFAASALGHSVPNVGGWLDGIYGGIHGEIELCICCPHEGNMPVERKAEDLACYLFPQGADIPRLEAYFSDLLDKASPSIIHIFGTELPHSYAMLKACQSKGLAERAVVSIQGLVSVCAEYHYYANLPRKLLRHRTAGEWLKHGSLEKRCAGFRERGEWERKAFEIAHHVIGRTQWDRACTYQYNPKAQYHFCNESLRKSFYEAQWSIDSCEKHSLFVSQCNYPLKGFHHALKALAILSRDYPDAQLYTTGRDPLAKASFLQRLRYSSYERYLAKLIREYGLEGRVHFLGGLSEKEMRDRFLRTHVFVSPSSIENSPNSVGEAMLLGVPVVASNVGGVKDMLSDGEEGFLYPSDEPYMLAYYVSKLFESKDLALRFSANSRLRGADLFNRDKNARTLLEIYREIGT